MAIQRQNHQLSEADGRVIKALVDKILPNFHGKSKVLCENALLWSYCEVADGVHALPERSRSKRAALIVSKASRALVDAIAEVAALDDATVDALSAGVSTCRH